VRKIINSTYVSVDGVVENPHHWPASDVQDDAAGVIQTEQLLACDAVLMGRHTYDGFAPAWSSRSGDQFSDRMNSMRKYVVSSTLQEPEWNNTVVISGDVVTEIKALKQQPGQHIVQYGFGQLSHTLMQNGLLDELRLWVHPLFAGNARPQDLIFREGPLTQLTLSDTTTLKSGIVILSYELANTGAPRTAG
jgi:dihydrofolate reductase